MKANLYLHADSLKYNGTDTEEEFNNKFASLLDDLDEIRNNHGADNVIKISSSIAYGEVHLYGNQTIYNIADALDKEERVIIYSLLGNEADIYEAPLEDIEKLCYYDANEAECNTVIYLNKPASVKTTYPIKYMTFDRYQIVYGTESWHTFRRQIMGNHPGTPDEFMEECKKHFPNILFHSNCTSSIVEYIDLIPRKIVYYLSCMNDKFLEHLKNSTTTDENVVLADFCGMYGFDENGTRQSTPGKKSSYQFKFLKCGCADLPENYKKITCDPHMKIKWCDDNKKTPNNFTARIYFHYGDDEVAPKKILVGSIGPHI